MEDKIEAGTIVCIKTSITPMTALYQEFNHKDWWVCLWTNSFDGSVNKVSFHKNHLMLYENNQAKRKKI